MTNFGMVSSTKFENEDEVGFKLLTNIVSAGTRIEGKSKINRNSTEQFYITDLFGKNMKSDIIYIDSEHFYIETDNLATGQYFITSVGKYGKTTKKFIVLE
jgi:hypothetical protein